MCILAAALIGGGLSYREAQRRGRLSEDRLVVAAVGLIGGVLGAKLSMLIFLGPAEFFQLLSTIPSHGASWSGALIEGYLRVVLAQRGLDINRCTGDLVAPFLPLGQAIGRLDNFLAGDAYGSPAGLPWGSIRRGPTGIRPNSMS